MRLPSIRGDKIARCTRIDFTRSHERTHEPFDGNTATVGAERLRLRGSIVPAKFHCSRSQRIPRLFFHERHKRGVYTRKDLYANAALSGDTRCVAPAT